MGGGMGARMGEYPNIADHGLIGDLQTAALIDTDGTLDWFCAPRFDSPSLFGSLLDAERGGYCSVRPETDDYVSRQLYLPNTAILVTRFMTEEGVGELIDFMPVEEGEATDRHRLVRMLRVVRGTMSFVAEVKPKFDYGRAAHQIVPGDGVGAKFVSDDLTLTLHRIGEPVLHGTERAGHIELSGDGIRVTGSLNAGEMAGVMLETGGAEPRRIPVDEMNEMQLATTRFWRDWTNRSTYRGRWREMVARSAITLKLMTYAPTGALVAAPTAGLPEQVGGERNWDYRYTWIRDGSFSVYALLGLGYTEEAEAFVAWLMDRVHESVGTGSGPLKIMYRVDGSSDIDEESLEHFAGYRGSRPVRIGNGAADQLQLDIYGEAMDSIHLADTHGLQLPHVGWTQITDMLDWVCDNWDQPDEGIWETRGGRKDFTYGRFMCWVALDRGIRLAQSRGRPAPILRWREQRDAIYDEIMRDGWDEERGAFVQHQGTDVLDASNLADAADGLHRSARPDVALDARRDERGARLRQPRVPLQPERLARRAPRLGGHVHAVHVLVRGCARALGLPRGGPAHLREDADVREPPRALRRGDRAHGGAARELPTGVQPPLAHQRRHEPRLPARPRVGRRRPGDRQGTSRHLTAAVAEPERAR